LEDNRIEQFDKIVKMVKEARKALVDYWTDYSLYASFEYWMVVALFVAPLILLFFKIDKNKIFHIGFYGYSVHMIAFYIDTIVREMGYRGHPFPLIPVLPGFGIDSSIIPVTFMLVYQWTLNHNKNYYIYSGIAALCFAFLMNPIFVSMDIYRMYGKTNYLHVFLGYVLVLVGAKLITNVFLWLERKYVKPL
jgi:hypothetical protein